MPAAQASDEPFYVELGMAKSQEEAANIWSDLLKEHRDQLGGLQFYPVVIPLTQKRISLRILAGPIESKEDAQAICSALFKKKTQCFVVEGMESPEKTAARRAREQAAMKTKAKTKPAPLPWLVEKETKAEEAREDEKPGFWGRLFGGDEADEPAQGGIEISEPQNLTPREAKVEVAEAIPVPLSNIPTHAKPVFDSQMEGDLSETGSPAASEEVKVEKVGWLAVEKFATEDNASAFWQNVRRNYASLAAGLRVRIQRPLMAKQENNVTLNIGPFGSEQDAQRFCQRAIALLDSLLTCRFTASEPSKANMVSVPANRGDAYADRRRRADAIRRLSEPPPRIEITAYWAQVINTSSQGEALEQWEKVKSEQSDLLRDYPSRISSSMGGKKFSVRIGPIEMQEDASQLCSELQGRGVDCKVLSNK